MDQLVNWLITGTDYGSRKHKMAPFKRHAYDTEFKLKAVGHAVEHGNRAAAREFNINESMVRKWRKQEDDLRQVKKTKQSFQGEQSEMATVREQTRTVGC